MPDDIASWVRARYRPFEPVPAGLPEEAVAEINRINDEELDRRLISDPLAELTTAIDSE